jgi:hypothetical protein
VEKVWWKIGRGNKLGIIQVEKTFLFDKNGFVRLDWIRRAI